MERARKITVVGSYRHVSIVLSALLEQGREADCIYWQKTVSPFSFPENCRGRCEDMTSEDRRRLCRQLTGLREPIGLRLAWRSSLVLLGAHDIARVTLSRLQGGKRCSVHSPFRPSTGVLALMCAIRDYGRSEDYTLVGIGLGSRALFSRRGVEGHEFPRYRHDPENASPLQKQAHLFADTQILRTLSTSYSISTADIDLARAVGATLVS